MDIHAYNTEQFYAYGNVKYIFPIKLKSDLVLYTTYQMLKCSFRLNDTNRNNNTKSKLTQHETGTLFTNMMKAIKTSHHILQHCAFLLSILIVANDTNWTIKMFQGKILEDNLKPFLQVLNNILELKI